MEVAIAKIFYYRACGYFGVNARKQLRTQVTTSWLVERGLVLSATQRKRGESSVAWPRVSVSGRRSL